METQPSDPLAPSSHANPQRARIWWFVGIGFVAFWMLSLAIFGPRPSSPLENTGLSEPATYDWSLFDLNDQPVSFTKFRGKTVFLNFWATWCGPCVGEMPSITKLARDPRLKDKNITVVCVSTDRSSEPVRIFFEGMAHWNMTLLRTDTIPPVFQTDGIPATFVIAADGRIAASVVGASNWNEPHVVEFLERLASSNSAKR
jgi:thiol-disulfide isomerase/thioredoxin